MTLFGSANAPTELPRPRIETPLPEGARRIQLLCNMGLPDFRGGWGDIMDVPEQLAADMVTLKNAQYYEDDIPEPPKADPDLKMPYGNAVKADWIEWAVAQGCDPDEAEKMTKAQLQNAYGERL